MNDELGVQRNAKAGPSVRCGSIGGNFVDLDELNPEALAIMLRARGTCQIWRREIGGAPSHAS